MNEVFTSIDINVAANVTRGVGVGKTVKESSCTRPPVIAAVFIPDIQPNRFQINDSTLSAPIYNAQAFAAQYAWTRPRLKGKSLEST